MAISKKELLDLLKRAYEMEEVMASALLELADQPISGDNISQEAKNRISGVISTIKNDTLEHRKIVQDLIQKASEEMYGA